MQRFRARSEAEGELLGKAAGHRDCRQRINKTIQALNDNEWPYWLAHFDSPIGKAIEPLISRYKAAREAAEEQRKREILATPIDDAAWAKELARRAEIEQWRARRGMCEPR